MKNTLLAIAFVGILIGCTDLPAAPPPVAAQPPAPAAPAQKPKPETTLREGDNPSRINQLRDLQVVNIKMGDTTVPAWVMDNESKIQEGVMFLTDKEVKDNQGMVFVFPNQQPIKETFWNHNCPLALDMIFIGRNRKVVSIGQANSEDDTPVAATGPYLFVIEMKRGWSKKHGLKPGDPVGIPTSLKAAE